MLDFGHFVEINITLLLEPSRAEDDNELANSPILVHSLIPGETVVVRLASFGAGEIAFEAIWIDANWSNEAWRTSRCRFIVHIADDEL